MKCSKITGTNIENKRSKSLTTLKLETKSSELAFSFQPPSNSDSYKQLQLTPLNRKEEPNQPCRSISMIISAANQRWTPLPTLPAP